MKKPAKKTKKKGVAKIQNKAPRKQTPVIGNTGGAGMWGY